MNVGMLWFDNDPKTELDDKIERAANYYREKYGNRPTVCFVHPSMMCIEVSPTGADSERSESRMSNGLELRSNRSVLPNHFWIGINGTKLASSER